MTKSLRRRRRWRFKEEDSDCEKEEMKMDNKQGKVMVRRRIRTMRRRWGCIINKEESDSEEDMEDKEEKMEMDN